MTLKVNVRKIHNLAQLPEYATNGSGCFDIRCIDGGTLTPSDNTLVLRTGLAFEIPDDHVMLLFSRSGNGFKNGVRLSNSVGVIDSDYRGEVMAKLHLDGASPLEIQPESRMVQGIILKYDRVEFEEKSTLSYTSRGTGGFGSTRDV